MHFDFGGRRFVVAIAPRPLFVDGQPAKGKTDRPRCRVWLGDQLPRHERRKTLFHELKHLWNDLHGLPVNEEEDAVQTGEFIDAMMDQYQAQGGDGVLEQLNPEREATPRFPSFAMAQVSATCGHCGTLTAIGSIDTSAPQWDAGLSSWVVYRGFWCESCDSVTTWGEYATPDGAPKGLVEHPPPQVLRGSAAAQWIAEHRDTCRIIVA